jgi:hypothetical protein
MAEITEKKEIKDEPTKGIIHGPPESPYFVLNHYHCMICNSKIGNKEEHAKPFCDKCSSMMGFFLAPFNKKP